MPILTVFRSRLNVGVENLYNTLAEEASVLARGVPGFLEEKTFTATDGERVTVVLFADHISHQAWRDHPRHQEVQAIGRTKLYAEYCVYSAEVEYSRSFAADAVS
jgi:heme-degrading monooxygenase HmoA